jgi:hypothetical protein
MIGGGKEIVTWLLPRIHMELTSGKSNVNGNIILSLLNAVLTYAGVFAYIEHLILE